MKSNNALLEINKAKRHPNEKERREYIYIGNSQKRYTNNYKEDVIAPKIKQVYIKTVKNHVQSIWQVLKDMDRSQHG